MRDHRTSDFGLLRVEIRYSIQVKRAHRQNNMFGFKGSNLFNGQSAHILASAISVFAADNKHTVAMPVTDMMCNHGRIGNDGEP